MTANVSLNDTIGTWRLRTNQLLRLTVQEPLFNAQLFRANGGIFRVTSNAFFNGRVTANGRSLIINANTVQKGTAVFQRTLTSNGNSLIVNSNTIQNGTTLFQRNVTANGRSVIVNANTVQKGTFVAHRNLTANGNSLIVNANTVLKGTVVIQRNLTANGNAFAVNSNTTFNSSNTNIRGGSLFVTANTLIVSNTHQVTGTHVARKGAPIKHIGLGSNTYTLVLGDNGYYLRAANTGGMTLTVPNNSSVAFPVGSELVVVRTGANNHLEFANAAGVTMNYSEGKKRIATQYAAATLKKVGTNVWDLVGALST